MLASSANKPSHIRFKEEFENSKKESGYFCKKYEDYKYCGCVFKGKLPTAFNFPNYDTDNENEFFKLATLPVCGNEYFNQIKRCAMTKFYEDQKPLNAPKNDKYNRMLILLDGCASCTKAGTITGLRVTHFEEDGGFFSNCPEEKEFEAFRVADLSIKIGGIEVENSGAFAVPAVLSHRSCSNILWMNTISDKYVDIKLHVDYSCGGTASTKIINLPSIDVNSNKDRVVEMRGIYINLDNGHASQYALYDRKYKLYEKVRETWQNAQINCWTGTCKP
uniref:Uncharacterized protein n=2 Tax=Meloidogyne incognita group TaxID=654580 RepID=A0A914KTX4_MELIC